MKRIYVAGPYSANNVITVLDNIRNGIRASTELMLRGYSPFCPWLDFHFQLQLRDGEQLDVQDYYRYTLAWLPVSDAMLVLPGYETSKGTLAEIKLANEKFIPIYYCMEALDMMEGKRECKK
jgi:hypothetical protein